jgi:hypothetical protein
LELGPEGPGNDLLSVPADRGRTPDALFALKRMEEAFWMRPISPTVSDGEPGAYTRAAEPAQVISRLLFSYRSDREGLQQGSPRHFAEGTVAPEGD